MSLPVLATTAVSAVPVVLEGAKTVAVAAQSLKNPVTAVVAVTAIVAVTVVALKKKRISFKVGNAIHLEASD